MLLLYFLLILFLVAILAGFIGSLAGIGGGLVVMPVLVVFFQVPFVEAVGASAVSILATSIASGSAYVHDHMTDIRIGMFLEIATVPGAFAGIAATILISRTSLQPILLILLGLVLLCIAPASMMRWGVEVPIGVVPDSISTRLQLKGTYHDKRLGREVEYEAEDTKKGLGTMFFAGLVSGMFGIGGGVFKVVALEKFMRLPMKIATATSNFMIGVTVAASASVLFAAGYINPALAAPVALGTALGAFCGSKVFPFLSNQYVRVIFIPVIVILAVEVILTGLGVL